MTLITVGMGDLKVSADPNGILVTYALGSCIAVLVHDPVVRAAGMIHYMLPHSAITPEKALKNPAMFADTGVPLLFERLYALSCRKSNLVVKVVGGSCIHDERGTFEIGRRNYAVLRELFFREGITISAEDVGGAVSRTPRLFVGSGLITLKKSDSKTEIRL